MKKKSGIARASTYYKGIDDFIYKGTTELRQHVPCIDPLIIDDIAL